MKIAKNKLTIIGIILFGVILAGVAAFFGFRFVSNIINYKEEYYILFDDKRYLLSSFGDDYNAEWTLLSDETQEKKAVLSVDGYEYDVTINSFNDDELNMFLTHEEKDGYSDLFIREDYSNLDISGSLVEAIYLQTNDNSFASPGCIVIKDSNDLNYIINEIISIYNDDTNYHIDNSQYSFAAEIGIKYKGINAIQRYGIIEKNDNKIVLTLFHNKTKANTVSASDKLRDILLKYIK